MGCDETREDLEEKILNIRMERDQIRKEREYLLTELKLTTGEELHPEPIPDYIDINYIKEKKRKMIEKQIKKMVKQEAIRQQEEERKKKELEEELKRIEREGYDEEFLYQPLGLKVKNNISELDDIYGLNYVLKKKDKEEKNGENKEELDESKDNKDKKKSNFKKNKKVKFNANVKEDEENKENKNKDNNNGDDIDEDIFEKVDAKIATKTGSINSVLGRDKNKIKNRISKNNSVMEDDSKSINYITPHLQPED